MGGAKKKEKNVADYGNMGCQVSKKGYKIKNIFCQKSTYSLDCIVFIEFAVVHPLCINFGVVDHFIVRKRLENTKFRKNWTVQAVVKQNIVFCQ